jgi:hypothetical protein
MNMRIRDSLSILRETSCTQGGIRIYSLVDALPPLPQTVAQHLWKRRNVPYRDVVIKWDVVQVVLEPRLAVFIRNALHLNNRFLRRVNNQQHKHAVFCRGL